MHWAYSTPIFAPSDPLVCRTLTFRPEIWAVLFNELQRLGGVYSWQQNNPSAATVAEVTEEIRDETDRAVFSGCIMLGEIKMLCTAVPEWCLICDGAEYDADDYPDLFAIIDDAYKTSGTTFVTPDMFEVFPRGKTVPGGTGGTTSYTQTIAQMPTHGHGQHAHSEQDPGTTQAAAGTGAFALADPGLPGSTGSSGVDDTGGGEAMDIEPPYHDFVFVMVAKLPTA